MEETIFQYLISQQNITEKLTAYNDAPAIFNREAPASTDEAWKPGQQYPRIIFGLDMQEDPERKTSGTLVMDVYKSNDVFLEDIVPVVTEAISGCFFSKEKDTIAVMWRQSEPFSTAEDGSEISGATITFDVVAFPSQHLSFPCPVTAVDAYLKKMFPEYIVMGEDSPSGMFRASDEKPVLYTRLQQINPGTYPGNYHVTWYNPIMVIHVIAPSVTIRETVLKFIIERMRRDIRIMMPDKAPMMLQRVTATMGADQLKVGQLIVEGTYGILREYAEGTMIDNLNINQ